MKRAAFDPVPLPDPSPAVTRTGRGMGVAPPLILGLVAAGLAVRYLPHWTARQRQAFVAGTLLAWSFTWPVWQGNGRTRWPSRSRRWLAGSWAGAVVAGWSVGYIAVGAAAVCPVVLWGASRAARARGAQPIEAVKPDPCVSSSLEGRWQSAAVPTGLVTRRGEVAGQPLELAGPAVPNGVGGQVLTVQLGPGITPDGVARRTDDLRRWHLGAWLFVRPAGGDPAVLDLAEIHVYDQRPLAARPIPWQRLGEYYCPGVQAIPYAVDVFGEALHLDGRLCTFIVGETGGGKTCVQLALLASCALAGLPVQVHLADNRSDGDLEMSALAGAVAGYARSAPEVWWQVHLQEMEIAHRRDAGLSADNATFAATDEWPLMHLAIAEALTLLSSRPPGEPVHGMSWGEFTGGRFDRRPDVKDWRTMIAETLGAVAREGRSVGVSWSAGTQAGQLDAVEGMKLVRRYVAQNIVMRVRHGADVDPALGTGALAGGAAAHELPPNVPGLLYVRPDGLAVVHGRAAWVPGPEIRQVAALLHAAEMDRAARSSNRGGNPA